MQDAREVTSGLLQIAAMLRFAGESRFRVQAYERAAETVTRLGENLGALVEQGRLRDLEGIGPALSEQIRELWNTGSSELLLWLESQHPEGAADLMQVPGMTPRRIRALHAALGIRSVEQLRQACEEGRVREVPGYGEKTEQKLLAACRRESVAPGAAPRQLPVSRALELADFFQRRLSQVAEEVHVAGALRRGVEVVRELTFVVSAEPERALSFLSTLPQVLRVDFDTRIAHLAAGVPLELVFAGQAAGSALFRATGDAEHVCALEQRAAARGVRLDRFSSEAALYAALGLAPVPPELRDGQLAIEQAEHGGFGDLVDAADIQGFVHCHSTFSDGKNTILELATAAHALGMKYITITDHSPSAHYARGLALDRLEEQWDEIAAAEERVPIRILRGTEADILRDGRLDFPDAVLERFDVLIASIHARHGLDREAMTTRLIRALSLPVFKIWGHALGRIIGHRDAIDCDVPAVLDALARSRGAIELNADPHRLDLPPAWIPAARARGIPFVISVDAHSTRGFDSLRYGVMLARRGAVRRQEVLNTQPPDTFAALVRPA